jgi:hypothetical protein
MCHATDKVPQPETPETPPGRLPQEMPGRKDDYRNPSPAREGNRVFFLLRRNREVDLSGKYGNTPIVRSDRTGRLGRFHRADLTISRLLPECVEDGNQPFPLTFSGVRPV